MDISTISGYFQQYGAWAVFVIVLLEYCNLPGFPAGVIMPLAGLWAAQGNLGFWTAIGISTAAGLLGSWILYFIGLCGGQLFLNAYLRKFPSHKAGIDRTFDAIRRRGPWGVFVSKLIPMVRTIISIPAGVLKMRFDAYTLSSAAGVFVWNFVFVGAGYIGGEAILQYLA